MLLLFWNELTTLFVEEGLLDWFGVKSEWVEVGFEKFIFVKNIFLFKS